jgi:flagellar hook-associated protein 3 FlgL
MALRSVNPYTSYQVLLDLQRVKGQMATLTEQIASGNRLTKLGDDPTASALVLNFQDSIQKNDAYIKQANSAASFLQETETTLQALDEYTVRLQELGTQALGPSTTVSGRAAIAKEVTGIRDNILALANTQSQGKYLFGGTRTTTPPFALTATGATYSGDHNTIQLDVSTSTTVNTNIPGDTAFFNGVPAVPPAVPPTTGSGSSGDIFTQVTNLLNGLNDANLATGTATIQTAFDNIKTIMGNNLSNITELGGRQSALQQLKDTTEAHNLSLQTVQDSYQALDYPTAMADYSQAQIVQQASLTVLGKMNTMNLFNYLA